MLADFYNDKSDIQKEWIEKVEKAFIDLYGQEDLDFLSDTILPNVAIGKSSGNSGFHSLTEAYSTFENYIAAYLTSYAGTDAAIKKRSYDSDYKNAAKCLYTLQVIPHAIQTLYNELGKNIFNANGVNKYILIPDGNGKKPVNCDQCYFGFLNASINFWKMTREGGWNYINLKLDFAGDSKYGGFSVFTSNFFAKDPTVNKIKLTFVNYSLKSPRRKTLTVDLNWFTKANIESVINKIGD